MDHRASPPIVMFVIVCFHSVQWRYGCIHRHDVAMSQSIFAAKRCHCVTKTTSLLFETHASFVSWHTDPSAAVILTRHQLRCPALFLAAFHSTLPFCLVFTENVRTSPLIFDFSKSSDCIGPQGISSTRKYSYRNGLRRHRESASWVPRCVRWFRSTCRAGFQCHLQPRFCM